MTILPYGEVSLRLTLGGFQQEIVWVSPLPAGSLKCEKRTLRLMMNHRGQKTFIRKYPFWLRPLGRAVLLFLPLLPIPRLAVGAFFRLQAQGNRNIGLK